MRKLIAIAATTFIVLDASAGPANQESVEVFLTATRAEAVVDSMYRNRAQMMRHGMQQVAGPCHQVLLVRVSAIGVPTKKTDDFKSE